MDQSRKLEPGDLLLDSRTIRRHTWEELHKTSMRRFEIEKIGYKTKGELLSEGIQKWPTVDTMIRRARENMKEAKRFDEERAERKGKAEMDLLATALAPRKNNQKGRLGWAKVQL